MGPAPINAQVEALGWLPGAQGESERIETSALVAGSAEQKRGSALKLPPPSSQGVFPPVFPNRSLQTHVPPKHGVPGLVNATIDARMVPPSSKQMPPIPSGVPPEFPISVQPSTTAEKRAKMAPPRPGPSGFVCIATLPRKRQRSAVSSLPESAPPLPGAERQVAKFWVKMHSVTLPDTTSTAPPLP